MTEAERERNLVSLKEYIESRLDAADKAMMLFSQVMDARFEAAEKGMNLFRDTLDLRLESMNEFREENRKLSSTLVTRSQCATLHDRTAEDIRCLLEAKAMAEGKASQLSVNITFLFAAIGIILGIVTLVV